MSDKLMPEQAAMRLTNEVNAIKHITIDDEPFNLGRDIEIIVTDWHRLTAENVKRKKATNAQAVARYKAEAENAALVEALEIDPEELARLFHEVYEAQAPMFGYETKPETRCQWADMPEDNKRLMISVCTRIIGVLKVRTALERR